MKDSEDIKNDRPQLRLANAEFIPEIISMLNEGHSVTLPLRGNSMRPFLENERDKVLLLSTNINNVVVGDAVLAEIKPKLFVLHRIIKIEDDNITLCGDGNLTFEHCTVSGIKAKAIAFYRKGRTVADYTDGHKWKIYSYIWTSLFPIRRYLLFLYRYYIRIFH